MHLKLHKTSLIETILRFYVDFVIDNKKCITKYKQHLRHLINHLSCVCTLVKIFRVLKKILYSNNNCLSLTMEKWRGKTAVVTGASRGIGASIALGLAKSGMNVIGLARTPELIEVLRYFVNQIK